MLNAVINNLINIGWAMLIFMCAYLSNMSFSMYYNIKIQLEPFSKDKLMGCQWRIYKLIQQCKEQCYCHKDNKEHSDRKSTRLNSSHTS